VLPARSDVSASGEFPHAVRCTPAVAAARTGTRGSGPLFFTYPMSTPLDVRTSVACRCFHQQWQVRLSHHLRDRMTRGFAAVTPGGLPSGAVDAWSVTRGTQGWV
jgi:hypothetical protein